MEIGGAALRLFFMENAEILVNAILKLAARDYINLATGKTVAPYRNEKMSVTKMKINGKNMNVPSLEELNEFFSSEWCHLLFECAGADRKKLLDMANKVIKDEWSK